MRKVNYLVSALTAGCAAFMLNAAEDVREGLVSYWTLDESTWSGNSLPDEVSGNDLTTVNVEGIDFAPGHKGDAVKFDSFVENYAFYTNPEGVDSGLPVGNNLNWTVTLWVNAEYPFEAENDRRAYSESSSSSNDPLINIGTHNGGADDTVDIYIRDGGVRVNHFHSQASPYDGEWRFIALVFEANEDESGQGTLTLYVDDTVEEVASYTPGSSRIDTVSLGAIVREDGANIAAFFTGALDEVAVWERALATDEVMNIRDNGVQTPVPTFGPAITRQPKGNTQLVESDSYTLSVKASGSRPFDYQWKKNGENLSGKTDVTLTLSNVITDDSGTYSAVVSNSAGEALSEGAEVVVSEQDLAIGLVAHWPLDEVCGAKTIELVNEYDMNMLNLTAADLVPGKYGQAFSFKNDPGTLLWREHNAGEELPANQHESFTVSMWTKVAGAGQTDLRVFSEGNTGNSDPLFNIGTHNDGTDGTVDLFFRQSGWTTVNHLHSTQEAFDDEWRHLVFVQRSGERALYVDAVEDDLAIPAKEAGDWLVNDTTIGGILRASASHMVTGLIDDVAIWSRGLSPDEIQTLFEEGVPSVVNKNPPKINQFFADFPDVVKGDKVFLRWDTSRDTTLTLDQSIGDVTGVTECGTGSVEVTIDASATFTLTATRAGQSVTEAVTVTALDGVAEGWRVVDTFDTYEVGPVANTSRWQNPEGMATIACLGECNQALGFDGGDDLNALQLQSFTLDEGEKATLFFRLYRETDDQDNGLGINVGLTEKPIRFVGDFDADVGPYVRLQDAGAGDGVMELGARDGNGSEYTLSADFYEAGEIYNVWIDIENGENSDVDTGDIYSVYAAKEGESTRKEVFRDFMSDRNPLGSEDLGPPKPDLSSLLISAINEDQPAQGIEVLLIDDVFMSVKGDFNDSVPIAASSFGPCDCENIDPPVLTIASNGDQIQVGWDAGTLESADTVTGNWSPVPGATPPTYTTAAGDQQKYYRAVNP